MAGQGRKSTRRNRKGTGTIYYDEERKTWVGRISLGTDAEGKRIRPTFYGKTQRAVQEQIDEARSNVLSGTLVTPDKITVKQHFTNWLRTKRPPRLAETTYTQYRWRFEAHIDRVLGHIRLQRLDYARIDHFYETLELEGLGPRTVFDIASLLKSGLKDAVKKGLIPQNPADQATHPTVPKTEARFMHHEEVHALLAAAEGEFLEEFFILALHTGLRASELLGLEWSHVDWGTRTLTIRQALHEVRGVMKLGNVKSEASRRRIKLSPTAINALRNQRKKQLERKMELGPTWDNTNNFVFTSTTGTPLIRTNITKRDLRRILRRANLDGTGIGIHTFRHTHASMLIAAGTDILAVSRRLGHESIKITLDLYGHLMPGQDDAAADVMEELFGG